MRQMLRAVASGIGLMCLAALASAQPTWNRTAHPYIRATAEATVSAKPDCARLTIGVVTQAPKAESAAAQNAEQSATMLAALRRSLGANADIHTTGYSLTPDFTYPKNGGRPILSGYTASNTVEITTDDLANAGKVIDAATQAGANNVRNLEFLLKNDAPVRARALAEAAKKARASAEAIAAALGLKVVRVLSAEEGEPQVIRPMPMMARAAAANVTTPIESGNIRIQATVTLTVEVAP